MTPPKTLENLTYRENINTFQWVLHITNQTSSQTKIYLVWMGWKVNKTSYSSGDGLREEVAVRPGKVGSSGFYFFKCISDELYLLEVWRLFHVLLKASWKKKITEFCNNSLRCQSDVPKSTEWVMRVQCALPWPLCTVLCGSCSQEPVACSHIKNIQSSWNNLRPCARSVASS